MLPDCRGGRSGEGQAEDSSRAAAAGGDAGAVEHYGMDRYLAGEEGPRRERDGTWAKRETMKRGQLVEEEEEAEAEEGVCRRDGPCLWHATWPKEKVGDKKYQPDGCGPSWRVISPSRLY